MPRPAGFCVTRKHRQFSGIRVPLSRVLAQHGEKTRSRCSLQALGIPHTRTVPAIRPANCLGPMMIDESEHGRLLSTVRPQKTD